MKAIEIPNGFKKCPTCYGSSQVVISCCSGDIIDDDLMMCPECHEHLGEETCPDCEGKGYVPQEKTTFSYKSYGLNTIAELKRDQLKDQ